MQLHSNNNNQIQITYIYIVWMCALRVFRNGFWAVSRSVSRRKAGGKKNENKAV